MREGLSLNTTGLTPDFFLFEKEGQLVYWSWMDDSQPENSTPLTSKDLRTAPDAVLEDKQAPIDQKT
jgi:hypothetical protein